MSQNRERRVFGSCALTALVGATFCLAGESPQLPTSTKTLHTVLKEHNYSSAAVEFRAKGRPVIECQIGRESVPFLIDTATSNFTVHRDVVDWLKLPTRVGDKPLNMADQSAPKAVLARVESFRFAGATMSSTEFSVDERYSRPSPGKKAGQPYGGTVGDLILSSVHAVIDFPGAKFYLGGPAPGANDAGDFVGQFLKSKRYVETPCTRKGGLPYLRCKAGNHELTLILDTGSTNTILDRPAAERVGVKFHRTPPVPGDYGPGAIRQVIAPLPGTLVFAGVETPENSDVEVCDLAGLNRALERDGFPQADGLFGINLLEYFSAAIDYSRGEPRLFLIDPFVLDEKLLSGEWVADAAENVGRPLPPEVVSKISLTVKGVHLDLWYGGNRHVKLTIKLMCPDPNLRTIDLESEAGGAKAVYPSIYEVSADRLRLCIPLELKPGQKAERPKTFTTQEGSPDVLLTFRRVPPK